jgi:hypothetical protein
MQLKMSTKRFSMYRLRRTKKADGAATCTTSNSSMMNHEEAHHQRDLPPYLRRVSTSMPLLSCPAVRAVGAA